MGAYRYCSCGAGMRQITVDQLQEVSWSTTCKVQCHVCDKDRDDDTPEERFNVLLSEVVTLRKHHTTLVKVVKKIGQAVSALMRTTKPDSAPSANPIE